MINLDNLFFKYIKELAQNTTKDTKYVIYGAGGMGCIIARGLRCIGIEPSFFADGDKKKWNTIVDGLEVMNPECLLVEKKELKILVASSEYKLITKKLENNGFVKNKNIFDFNGLGQHKKCDIMDPLLGYTRMDDIEGFKIYGRTNSEMKIVILGNSTSDYTSSNIKSWSEIFYEIYGKGKLAVYNGAISGYFSGQELMKLIRDVILLKPDIVISLSGINDPANNKRVKETALLSTYLLHQHSKCVVENTEKKIGIGIGDSRSDAQIWSSNMRLMRAICKEFGIIFMGFLQPSLHCGAYNISLNEEVMLKQTYTKIENKRYVKFFEEAIELIKNEQNIYDFTGIFDGMEGVLYDHCHADEKGNKIIAEKIAAVLDKTILNGRLNNERSHRSDR